MSTLVFAACYSVLHASYASRRGLRIFLRSQNQFTKPLSSKTYFCSIKVLTYSTPKYGGVFSKLKYGHVWANYFNFYLFFFLNLIISGFR